MTTEYVIGNVDDVPEGSQIIVQVGDREIGIFNVHGSYYALPNTCVHQSGPLCRGAVSGTLVAGLETDWQREWTRDGEIIVCPWHALEFDITTGQCLAYPNKRVRAYPVRVENGKLKLVL